VKRFAARLSLLTNAMEHTLAHQTDTIDKYLMRELSHEERLAFEEHLFDCPECAARVKEDYDMIADLKAVLREPPRSAQVEPMQAKASWRDWFRPVTLVPAFAALALTVVVGYQNLVSIPGMLQPQVLDTTPMVATTRGVDSQAALVKPGGAFFGVSFEVSSPSVYPGYVCQFQAVATGVVTTMDCGKHSTAEFTLSLLLPSRQFPPGGYTMILRPISDKQNEVTRYAFAVKYEDK
jgi:putative zinc finger protein